MRALALFTLVTTLGCGAAVEIGEAGSTVAATYVEESCPEQGGNLIAGQHFDAGDISISNDDSNLYVQITTQDGWLLTETHIFAGTGSIPTNRKGTPVPGHFPYANSFAPGVGSYTEVIPLADLNVGCDATLKIAVHAVVERSVGDGTEEQTAWGDGEGFDTPRWAYHTLYTGCCEPPPAESCVEPAAFWSAADPSTWPRSFDGWVFCWSPETGGVSVEQIMAMEPTSFHTQLSQEYIAAMLNSVCAGADCPISKGIARTNYLTNDCVIDDGEQAEAEALYAMFVAYNTGNYDPSQYICPAHCD